MNISIAYSSDSDDALMIDALKQGLIFDHSYRFLFSAQDIQHLNQLACDHQKYHITAVSCAVYPLIRDHYQILSVGSSFSSKGLAPIIIVRRDSKLGSLQDLTKKNIAVAGKHTTSFLCSKILFNEFNPLFVPFDQIANTVLAFKADAGILIHEGQIIDNHPDFKILGNIGNLWFDRYQCDIPLGIVVIKRSLDNHDKTKLSKLYQQSIEFGIKNKKIFIDKYYNSLKPIDGSYKLSKTQLSKYIDQFVLKSARQMTKNHIFAMASFFSQLMNINLINKPINLEQDLFKI